VIYFLRFGKTAGTKAITANLFSKETIPGAPATMNKNCRAICKIVDLPNRSTEETTPAAARYHE
jgi:hypothetical protein